MFITLMAARRPSVAKDIFILVGPPAAGKSTWTEKEFQDECWVCSTDNIIQDMAVHENTTYNSVFQKYIKVAEKMMWEDFDRYVGGSYSPIIVDRTNMSVKARAKFFERLKQFHKGHGYQIHAVVFPKPQDAEHERRLNSRPGKTIPREVINSMLASFQMPTEAEGFASITIIED
jgi:predicted kinase